MGHMGNGAHGSGAHIGKGHMVNMCWIMCNFLKTAWILTKFKLLDINIDIFYLNIQ